MKKIVLFKALLICLLSFNTSCYFWIGGERPSEPGPQYKPVYMSRSDLNQSLSFQTSRSLSNPGKIYVYGTYLFINEKYKGIHIIDNSNPLKPLNSGFIAIAGNLDLAVRANVLYADNAVDLVAIGLSDMNHMQLLNRVESVFPVLKSPEGFTNYDLNKGIVVAWEKIK